MSSVFPCSGVILKIWFLFLSVTLYDLPETFGMISSITRFENKTLWFGFLGNLCFLIKECSKRIGSVRNALLILDFDNPMAWIRKSDRNVCLATAIQILLTEEVEENNPFGTAQVSFCKYSKKLCVLSSSSPSADKFDFNLWFSDVSSSIVFFIWFSFSWAIESCCWRSLLDWFSLFDLVVRLLICFWWLNHWSRNDDFFFCSFFWNLRILCLRESSFENVKLEHSRHCSFVLFWWGDNSVLCFFLCEKMGDKTVKKRKKQIKNKSSKKEKEKDTFLVGHHLWWSIHHLNGVKQICFFEKKKSCSQSPEGGPSWNVIHYYPQNGEEREWFVPLWNSKDSSEMKIDFFIKET